MTVIWITGLPGAGKSTIAGMLHAELKKSMVNTILLDGDRLRQVFDDEVNFDADTRKNLATKYSRLCRYLSEQGQVVIIATVSMFRDVRRWNRENIDDYLEVYVKVPLVVLESRDQKKLYSEGKQGLVSNVIGLDAVFEEPENPDLILDGSGETSLESLVSTITRSLQLT
jgi:adenylyl-sulfate kinase